MKLDGHYISLPDEDIDEIYETKEIDIITYIEENTIENIEKSWMEFESIFEEHFNHIPDLKFITPMEEEYEICVEGMAGIFLIKSDIVKRGALAIIETDGDEIVSKIDYKERYEKDVFPFKNGISLVTEEEFKEYTKESYEIVKEFYMKTARENKGILFLIE